VIVPDKYRGSTEYRSACDELIRVARAGKTIYYSDLANILGLPTSGDQMRHEVSHLLGEISEDEVTLHKRPMLSAVVVSRENNRPGSGFYELARQLKKLTAGEAEEDFWVQEVNRVYTVWSPSSRPWRDAVIAALHRYSARHETKTITRQGLIAEELAQITSDTSSEGQTPEQTLSRILQELQDEKILYFSSRGTYVLLDRPVEVEEDDLPDDAIDFALETKKLQLGNVETSDPEGSTRLRRGQARIRELTLRYYDFRCGFCDVSDRALLKAAHVSRWADDPPARGDLCNVVCMCSFHDVLFEHGYFALADDYRILKRQIVASVTIRRILDITETLRADTAYPPSPVFLRKHRIRTGFGV